MRTVLLVDDEIDIRSVVEMSLTALGDWSVTTVTSGPEALERLEQEVPNLILLDVMMPGMDGMTTLGKIREREVWASVPVIFMTAKVQKQEIDQYMRLGAVGVLSKPFDPMRLPTDIDQILAGAIRERDGSTEEAIPSAEANVLNAS